jgi:hypothetical protein
MSWLESHQSLRDHPKTRKLARRVGGIQQAIGILHLLWWWCIDYARDGDLSRHDAEDIAIACAWDGEPAQIIRHLTECGFIDETKKGLRVHDWMDYGGTLIAKKARDAARKRAGRRPDLPVDNSAVHGTSTGRPRDGARTDLPTYIPKSFATQKTALAPVHNSKLPTCAICGAEMQYNGDGSDRVHCTVCEPAAATS